MFAMFAPTATQATYRVFQLVVPCGTMTQRRYPPPLLTSSQPPTISPHPLLRLYVENVLSAQNRTEPFTSRVAIRRRALLALFGFFALLRLGLLLLVLAGGSSSTSMTCHQGECS